MAHLVPVENPPPANSVENVTLTADEAWEAFWCLYPRHVAKLAAKKAWAKVDAAQHVAILTALVAWRQVWRDKDPEYLPHASTWLNGERWEDELPSGFTASPQTAQNRPPRLDEPIPPRSTMPEHVRAALARLRGRQ